jgi:hydrogenase expression/formation protein HypE
MAREPDRGDLPLPAGKIPPSILAEFLGQMGAFPEDVIIGAAPGEDAAVIAVGDRYLVLAMDPVTLSARPGCFAVDVNANDIAVMGAVPRWLLATVILPAGTRERVLRSVLDDLRESCTRLGVTLLGGHTEISSSVTQPIVAACMVGEVAPHRLVRSEARAGDALLLGGPIAVEGTAILGREHGAALRDRGALESVIAAAAGLLDDPGISVLPMASVLRDSVSLHAMHDPTEGGIMTAVREMAGASRVGVTIEADSVPVLQPCRIICQLLDLDPLALLASGSLLAAVAVSEAGAAVEALRRAGIPGAIVGRFTPEEEGLVLVRDGREQALPAVLRDELARWEESQGGSS